ncbi:MAG: IclR family transcriptional regulator [Oceanospirillales bacterium]|nr:IclR family transcriptional regulator [Oceanospirillales bacterium]
MSSALQKALSVLEFLVENPKGTTVSDMAKSLGMPVSGVHRLLKELESIGYVRQVKDMGEYQLTIKLASLGLSYLGQTGISSVSQPVLDTLAVKCKELVRMAVNDNGQLVWMAVAQGSTSSLKYDPSAEQGRTVHLASTANGQAWLASMSDDEAIEAVIKQGLLKTGEVAKNAPSSIAQLLETLQATRERGYSVTIDTYLDGMAAMACVVRSPDSDQPIGTISIAGPSIRFTEQVMATHFHALSDAAQELGEASRAGLFFYHPH